MTPESSDNPRARPGGVPARRKGRGRPGPKTPDGRGAVRHNAVSHGIFANLVVIPELEREQDWETHRTGTVQSLDPRNYFELILAERVAMITWRMASCMRYEAALLNEQREKNPLPDGRNSALANATLLSETRRNRALFRKLLTMDENELLPPGRVLGILAIADQILSNGRSGAQNSTEVRAALYDPPGGTGQVSHPKGQWTVTELRDKITALAAAAACEVAEFIELAVKTADADENLLKMRARQLAAGGPSTPPATVPPAWLLLPPEQLELISRYEAHLNRQLLQTLHELEALQKVRRGETAPLARLDVAGLPSDG